MADLIDRAALGIGKANPKIFENAEYAKGWNSAIEILRAAPAVDAVKVVRCKECRFCKKYPTSDGGKMCTNQEWNTVYYPPVEDDDYCSRGERREDDGTAQI